MNRSAGIVIFSLVLIFGVCSLAYCQAIDIAKLVDDFQNATDLQKGQILKDNLGKDISAGGMISNAGEYDFFDTANDFKGTYYQVMTEQQKTNKNTPYQLIFLFKDKDEVQDMNKGTKIQKDGQIIRILDERLQISIWLFCGDLSEDDKALLK
ncbi:MAG: hypothetical protein M0R66_09370 [Candidatus Omnitrophica bacterium]|nr:hypothetical protein [Candidatus Omnitrophota bacterium]